MQPSGSMTIRCPGPRRCWAWPGKGAWSWPPPDGFLACSTWDTNLYGARTGPFNYATEGYREAAASEESACTGEQ